MPLIFSKEDIFNLDVKVVVNPVNCVGVMGAGLAKEFKARFPNHYEAYKEHCNEGLVKIGGLGGTPESNGQMVTYLPTKQHWKDPSKLEYIEEALKSLKNYIITHKWPSVAIPALGCGLGGLHWKDVKQLIKTYLNDINFCTVYALEPRSKNGRE